MSVTPSPTWQVLLMAAFIGLLGGLALFLIINAGGL